MSLITDSPLQIAPNDQSVYYLGRIFGSVGTVLSGTGSNLLSTMFGAFNTAILVLAVIIFIYTLIKGTIKTAEEGEFLGKNMPKFWVPFRHVAGLGALVPFKSGYCAIQIIMMWVVLQGVGAADYVWTTTVNYFQAGGTIVGAEAPGTGQPTGPNPDGTGYTQVYSDVAKVFQNLVCEAAMKKYLNRGTRVEDTQAQEFKFGTDSPNIPRCGTLSWKRADPKDEGLGEVQHLVYQQIVATLAPIATRFVNDADTICVPPKQGEDNPCDISADKDIKRQYATALWTGNGTIGGIYAFAGSNFVRDAAFRYYGDINNYIKQTTRPVDYAMPFEKAKANGWMFAGAYYFYIAKNVPNPSDKALGERMTIANPTDWSFAGSEKNINNFYALSSIADPNTLSIAMASQRAGGGEGINIDTGVAKGGSSSAVWVKDAFKGIFTDFNQLLKSSGTGDNPIIVLHKFGDQLLLAAEIMWLTYTIAMVATIAATALMSSVNSAGYAASAFFSSTTAILVFVLGALITTGALLGYYLPLVPYIYFTLGSISWLVAVIEVMIAAPIVAIGIIFPEGQHEILGRAEPAVMIITNVFLRPVLMLFGMMGGMLLSYVGVTIVNAGFFSVIQSLGGGGMGIIAGVTVLCTYTGLQVIIITKCMKLIVDVPDKILRFISGSPETFGETESLGEVRGKAEAGAGTGGEAFKGAGGKAGDTMGATSGAVQKAKGEDQIAATKDKALSGDNTGGLTRLAGTGKEGKGGAEVPPPAGKEKPPEGGAGGAGGGGPGAPGGP